MALQQADAFNKKVKVQEQEKKKDRRGLTASGLKVIAMVALLFQNIAYVVLDRIMDIVNVDMTDQAAADQFFSQHMTTLSVYFFLVVLGYLALPILCYLLVEGYTKSTRKIQDIAELGVFALLSEVPFDLAMQGKVLEFTSQNMYMSLFVGLLAVAGVHYAWEQNADNKLAKYLLTALYTIVALFAGILGGMYLCFAPLVMVCMYIFKDRKMVAAATGCLSLSCLSIYNLPFFLSLIPIKFYNGKPGRKMGYILYLFYPVHLLVLYFIVKSMNLL